MGNSIGKIVYPAIISLEGEYYKVYFPDFDVAGNGFKDLPDTVCFAANMLSEIIIDYMTKGLDLPKPSSIESNDEENTISKYIEADVDEYDSKSRRNRERRFYIHEDPLAAESSQNTKEQKLFSNKTDLKKFIATAIVAIIAIVFVAVMADISDKHSQERWQAKNEEEIVLVEEYLQMAREDIKQELYNKAQEDLGKIRDLDTIEYDYRRSERDSLYCYAQLLALRSNGSIIDDQYDLIDNIEFSRDDEFYDEYNSLKAEIIDEYNSAEVKGKLQHYFLAIDGEKDLDELKSDASAKGFYTEIADASIMQTLYISEHETKGYGYGSEVWYMYDDDHIEVVFFQHDDNPGVWEPSFKSYSFQKKYMRVQSRVDERDIFTENRLPGYIGEGADPYEKIEDYKSLEDAMKYANDYEYSESE